MSVALLDINVLIALFDPEHIHHESAHAWFAAERHNGWATCPLTENGCVRIISSGAYQSKLSTAEAIANLGFFTSQNDHVFWPDALAITSKIFIREHIERSNQITDVYLLGLAVTNRGRLVTFDRSVAAPAVSGATTDHLFILQNPQRT